MNKGYASNELYFHKRPHGTHSRPDRYRVSRVYARRELAGGLFRVLDG